MANAAKALGVRRDMRFEHGLHRVAPRQIDETDNARAQVGSLRPRARDLTCEFRLANRPKGFGTVRAVAPTRLNIDRGFNIMPAFEIRNQFIREITNAGPVIEMVMRVDDRQICIKRRFMEIRTHVASSSSGASFSGKPSSKAFKVSATRL